MALGIEPADHQVMGHEYVGVVEEVGSEVKNVKVGDFVVGSFVISDNTCEIRRAGFQSQCVRAEFVAQTIGTQAEKARIPHADGTLVATPGQPDPELIPSLLAASDVLGTGWYAAVAAEAGPGKTVAVVGDGAVGLMAVLAGKQLGADRIIAMSRHPEREKPARYAAYRTEPPSDRGNASRAPLARALRQQRPGPVVPAAAGGVRPCAAPCGSRDAGGGVPGPRPPACSGSLPPPGRRDDHPGAADGARSSRGGVAGGRCAGVLLDLERLPSAH